MQLIKMEKNMKIKLFIWILEEDYVVSSCSKLGYNKVLSFMELFLHTILFGEKFIV